MKNFNDVINEVDEVLNSAKSGNFDEVLSKTKSYAEKATKRSAERLEISKKKIELLDAKAKLTRAYEKYGKLMYLKNQDEEVSEDELASAGAAIELQRMRSDMLKEEIEELKQIYAEAAAKREEKSKSETEEADVEVVVVEPSEDE